MNNVYIKDTDRRKLPLTDDIIDMLSKQQAEQIEGLPYLFIHPRRYTTIQQQRKQGKWSVINGCNPINNFERQFKGLLAKAGIKDMALPVNE